MTKVAFVTSHPIQYQVPVFRELTSRGEIDFTVVFAHLPEQKQQGEGFGVAFEWDIPLLEGYSYHVLKNVAAVPSVTQYAGCDTPEIDEYVRRERFDAVIVNGWVVKTCVQALRACRKLGIPCLVRGEANHLRKRPWWKRIGQRMLVRQYAGCLVIGEANRQFYRSYGIPESRLFDCLYCVENDRFARVANDMPLRSRARKRWGIPESAVCFLYSGKFEAKKHPLELLKAFDGAIQNGMQAHLLMVGDGELRGDCERFVDQHQLPVHFTGFVNQNHMPEVYLVADCLVLPSDAGETWGLVVNEAMATGCPALVSDLVGCRSDLIAEGVTGWSFPFEDFTALQEMLLQLAASPELLRNAGIKAAQLIQRYSPQRAAEGIERAVHAVVRGRNVSPMEQRQ